MNLKKSVVVITGASSGIGRATALAVAKKGAIVVLASRQENILNEIARECESFGTRALAVKTDVTNEEDVKRLAAEAIARFGHIDVWINNAAVMAFGRFEETPNETYDRVIQTNVFGYIYGARSAIRHFRNRGRGTLINVSSVASKIGGPYSSAYNTSKFAISGFSESLRMELNDCPHISVSNVMPASIDTPLFQHAANYMGLAVQPMKPVYDARSVARVIIKCIQRPRREVFVGTSARAISLAHKLTPSVIEKYYPKMVLKNHFQARTARPSDGNLFEPLPVSIKGGWKGKDTRRSTFLFAALLAVTTGFVTYRSRQRRGRETPLRDDTILITEEIQPVQLGI